MIDKLKFSDSDLIGSVLYVDTNLVLIKISNDDAISNLNIGGIVAISTTKLHEFTIGIIDKVQRKFNESKELYENDIDSSLEEDLSVSSDIVQISIIGSYKAVEGINKNLFKRGIDIFPSIDARCYYINGNNLKFFMNIISEGISVDKQLKIGQFAIDDKATAVLDGDKFFQRHASILGSTGSGKSWCVANLLEEANELKNPNIIVLDMHGEYKSLCNGTQRYADYYKIAGPGDLENENDNNIFLPYWLLNKEELLSMILDRSDSNAPNQSSRFILHVRALKESTLKELNKEQVLRTFTMDSPIPFDLSKLIKLLQDDDTKKGVGVTGKSIKGDWEGKLTRFISRIETKFSDKRYGFLFQPPKSTNEYDWLSSLICKLIGTHENKKGIKIIDFSEVPSDVLPVVTGIFARLLFDIQIWIKDYKRTPFAILCDEAHLYLPTKENADIIQKQSLGNFERISKEGRKYGISLVVISQRPSDVSKTILSQCNNFLVLRLTNDNDKLVIKNLLPDALKGVIDQLPLLSVGEAVAVGDSILLPSKIRLKSPKLKPLSATKNFWNEWDSSEPDNQALIEAVESMRCQTKS